MSLTYQQIWERYSHVEFIRRMYIKRLNTNGTYEADFTEISQGLMKDGSVQGISRSLPNTSWEFGKISFDNISLQILSAYQEFASENDKNSIFFGFIRHQSIIKVVDAFIDKYTDPNNPVEASLTSFVGLLDSRTAQTEQGYESITALDFLTVLDNVNVQDLGLTRTTLSALVYEVLNRPQFTKYFNVSNTTTYILPGYDLTGIDLTKYTGTVGDMFEDLAKGHSIFYVNLDDNFFYFTGIKPTENVQYSFLEANNRKLLISAYREGIDRQITNWYWDSNGEFLQNNWTSVDWTGNESNGWIHTTGNTTVLSESTVPVSNLNYNINITVTDRTAGSFSLLFGGQTFLGLTASQAISILTTGIDNLQITPTSDFDGTIGVSIQLNIFAIASPPPVVPIPQNFSISGVTDPSEQQNLLNFLLAETKDPSPYFSLQIPYFPVIKILDKVIVQSFGSAPVDAARWGMFIYTSKDTNNPSAAPRWAKPAGIRISADETWMVRGIDHDANLNTTLELQRVDF